MSVENQHNLAEIIKTLSDKDSIKTVCHQQHEDSALPSVPVLEEIVNITRSIIFPGYFGNSSVNIHNLKYHIGVNIEKLYSLLSEQILAGLCFHGSDNHEDTFCHKQAKDLAAKFIARLPHLREVLTTDVVAAYNGDPAAKSHGEVIFCYPAIRAISNYRVANALLQLGVPIIPRIITEMAHSETGIDIHPGATIGAYFTIDHGTGVVIGETSIIGNNVKLYQGVTLGAKSFPLDEKGNPIKGIDRHPILEDEVIVYSNASILGRVTIGRGAVIGGNIWIENDVPAGAKILQKK
jgi:serine O-acetyltransferase